MSGEMEEEKVTVYVMGKKYDVPMSWTIMDAMEYAGYRLIRGCGCRCGFCGACATVFRRRGEYKLEVGLACQTVVEDGMYLAQIPFFPATHAEYDIEDLEPTPENILKEYPELYRCVSCNTCTRACPQDIEVMDYVQAALRGDIAEAADLSFDCIMCGLCAARCPAEITQYNVAILCRRLFGRYINPKSRHLEERVKEIEGGKFDDEMEELMKLGEDELRKKYAERYKEY